MTSNKDQQNTIEIADKDQLTRADKAILGKCGIFCGACDAYLGKAKAHAKELFENLGLSEEKVKNAAEHLLEVMDQVNYDDGIGCFFLGVNTKQYQSFKRILKIIAEEKIPSKENSEYEDFKDFQRVLRKFVGSPNCLGCGAGAGVAKSCPIAICCEERGYLTCAECPDIQLFHMCRTILEKQIPSMITDNCTYFRLITRRYMNWNVENLKKIIRKGYKKYIDEMREKVQKGFYAGQVISKEPVFKNLLGF
ncbi:MAG: DUF3795 domain-containing protein [Candidatus Helarchaeota archaeon]